jgi:hypothetical protein
VAGFGGKKEFVVLVFFISLVIGIVMFVFLLLGKHGIVFDCLDDVKCIVVWRPGRARLRCFLYAFHSFQFPLRLGSRRYKR